MAQNIFNIAQSCSFTDTLAEHFTKIYENNPQELSQVLFLLPNRRACLSLRDAFVRLNGLKPTILPKMVPIGDIEEDDIFLQSQDGGELLQKLPPAINKYERQFLFARLIASKPSQYGLPEMTFAQAFALAGDLAKFMDEMYNEQLSFEGLADLVPAQYASHWQDTLQFLKIVSQYWPAILQERGVADVAERKNILLKAQAEIWAQNPPQHKVVAAGITGAFPGMKELLKTLASCDSGEIYLYGLDTYLSDDDWQKVDESHPQFELKQLLDFLNISRFEVKKLVEPQNPEREVLVSEIMRPAATTVKWRLLKADSLGRKCIEGLKVISCQDMGQEASAIAVLMREVLEVPTKTAALVTPDRVLARRVAAELERWNIKIDDSAGKPLHLTPLGIYLRAIIRVIEEDFSQSSVLALAKSPFMRLGKSLSDLRRSLRQWELCLRKPTYSDNPKQIPEELEEWLNNLKSIMKPLCEKYALAKEDFKALLTCHLEVAERLADEERENELNSGAKILWKGEDGRKAAALFAEILPESKVLEKIEPHQYLPILTSLMSAETVRPVYGTHPRLKILGPIEARFNHYDTVIIGGVNEGIWPKLPSSDPWMSRPMKKDFGLSLPERAVGITAADFCQLMCAKEVYLTRSSRVMGTPMNKSRWLLRLETVLTACGFTKDILLDGKYLSLAELQDEGYAAKRVKAPTPCPPVTARPRKLSASSVETLIRDPYAVFASKILRLKPLDELDKQLSQADYGNIVHAILEEFNNLYPSALPLNAKDELIKIGQKHFAQSQIKTEVRAFWWPQFLNIVEWLLSTEGPYREGVAKVYSEARGSIRWQAPAGDFTLEARADRIDINRDGTANIIDYKTGEPRSNAEVQKGYAPQLPLEGLIASQGGFCDKNGNKISTGQVDRLIYWKLGEKTVEIKETQDLLERTAEQIKELVALFDFECTPYLARPNPKHLPKYSDYEHLARVKEWSTEESDD